MNAFARGVAVLLPVVMLWGCSTTSQVPESSVAAGGDRTVIEVDETPTSTVEVTGMDEQMGYTGDPLNDPDSLLSKRTVYFDFDKSEIKPEARQIIEAHADYLAANPNVRIVLEGHCDERGTREYNLSLGERRAKAVERVMSLLGAASDQVELVSYGEERPVAMGHDEAAWELNRRVEFIY